MKLLAENVGEYAPGVRLDSTEWESVSGAIHPSTLALLDSELLGEARSAISLRQRIRLRYYRPHQDEEAERTVQPYHLRFWRGEAYLIAWRESRGAQRFSVKLRPKSAKSDLSGDDRHATPPLGAHPPPLSVLPRAVPVHASDRGGDQFAVVGSYWKVASDNAAPALCAPDSDIPAGKAAGKSRRGKLKK